MKDEVQNLTQGVGNTFKEFLEFQIFSLGKYSLSVYEVLAAVLIVLFGIFIVKFIDHMFTYALKICQ